MKLVLAIEGMGIDSIPVQKGKEKDLEYIRELQLDLLEKNAATLEVIGKESVFYLEASSAPK